MSRLEFQRFDGCFVKVTSIDKLSNHVLSKLQLKHRLVVGCVHWVNVSNLHIWECQASVVWIAESYSCMKLQSFDFHVLRILKDIDELGTLDISIA